MEDRGGGGEGHDIIEAWSIRKPVASNGRTPHKDCNGNWGMVSEIAAKVGDEKRATGPSWMPAAGV